MFNELTDNQFVWHTEYLLYLITYVFASRVEVFLNAKAEGHTISKLFYDD